MCIITLQLHYNPNEYNCVTHALCFLRVGFITTELFISTIADLINVPLSMDVPPWPEKFQLNMLIHVSLYFCVPPCHEGYFSHSNSMLPSTRNYFYRHIKYSTYYIEDTCNLLVYCVIYCTHVCIPCNLMKTEAEDCSHPSIYIL